MFIVEYNKPSRKTLRRLPRNLARQIFDKMNGIAQNPCTQHNNVKPLKGTPYYRLRVGDWRVVYEIQNERIVILVLTIAPRGEVYK
jgi:mRNA interferase RelE/StbE